MSNGWTPERRARQAALIHKWRPWEQSTGPITPAGKARVSYNAVVHGAYTAQEKENALRLATFMRACGESLKLLKK